MKYCYRCHTEWDGIGQPGIHERCSKCFSDLHICSNCRFYNEHKPNRCQSHTTDLVNDKEKANHCEEFQFADRALSKNNTESQKARDKWKRWFEK